MRNGRIQFSGVGERGPTLEEEAAAQEVLGIRSGVVKRLPSKSVQLTEAADGSLTTTPGEHLTIETGISPNAASIDSLDRQIKYLNDQIADLDATVENRDGDKATAILRLQRMKQPLLDARTSEFAAAQASGHANVYAADDETLTPEARAELLVRVEAQSANGIKTSVRRAGVNGPLSITVERMDSGDVALQYLAGSLREDNSEDS